MKKSDINALRNEALHDQIKTERQAKVYPGAMDDCDFLTKVRLAQSSSSENVSLHDCVHQLLQSSEYLNHSIAKKTQEISELKESNELLAASLKKIISIVLTNRMRIGYTSGSPNARDIKNAQSILAKMDTQSPKGESQ